MNSQKRFSRMHWSAGLVAIAVCAVAEPARATVTFSTDGATTRQIFCDMPVLRGEFHRASQAYVASGVCVALEAVQAPSDRAKNRSEFDQYSKSKEVWRARWTAEASYDPTTKVTTETITLPAPTIDEFAPANRPYGRFVSKMVCATDPWLETRASCTGIVATSTGSLGSLDKSLRLAQRPFTSTEKEPMRNALIAQQALALKRLEVHPETAAAQTGRAGEAFNSGKSFLARSGSTEPTPTRSGPTSTLAARPATAAPAVATAPVPASAPVARAARSPVLDWSRAAPSALGSR
ncbi:MAG: hypothetical protein ABI364_00350 [Caldimonas sp.]